MALRRSVVGIFAGMVICSLSQGIASATEPDTPQSDTTVSTSQPTAIPLPLLRPASEVTSPIVPDGTDSATATQSQFTVTEAYPPVPADVLAETTIPYGSYQTDVSNFKRNLESNADIEAAMDILGTHNANQLASGWLAYSALLASESEAFRKGVLDTEAFHGRERLLNGMRNSPIYTLSLAGADDALTRAFVAGKADARRLETAGAFLTEQAYSLQSFGWAKERLSGAPADHALKLRIAALDGRPQSGTIETLFSGPSFDSTIKSADALAGSTSLWDRIAIMGTDLRLPGISSDAMSRPQYTIRHERQGTAGNIVTLAALKIMEETDGDSPYVAAALNDPQAQACFQQAQLNLLQCVSASRNVFERPFCIGVHALQEIGTCVGNISQ